MITISKSDMFCIVLVVSACAQPLLLGCRKAATVKDQPIDEAQTYSSKATDNQNALLIREFSYEK